MHLWELVLLLIWPLPYHDANMLLLVEHVLAILNKLLSLRSRCIGQGPCGQTSLPLCLVRRLP